MSTKGRKGWGAAAVGGGEPPAYGAGASGLGVSGGLLSYDRAGAPLFVGLGRGGSLNAAGAAPSLYAAPAYAQSAGSLSFLLSPATDTTGGGTPMAGGIYGAGLR